MADIFLSVHVGSLGLVAKLVKTALEKQHGVKSVFLCTDLPGGANFREEIIHGVKQCKVFVAFMNRAWATSGECESEFLLAKRLNLTSHERGQTKPAQQPRRPVFLPVAFPNLNPWSDFAHVELLAASTNFVLAQQDNHLDERMISMIATMAHDLSKDTIVDASSHILSTAGGGSVGSAGSVNFGSLRFALDALDVYINQASAVLASATALTNKTALERNIEPGKRFPVPKPTYIGFTFGRLSATVESVFSLELRLQVTESGQQTMMQVSGTVTYKVCRITGDSSDAFIQHMHSIQATEASSELRIGGTYMVENGLLLLEDMEVLHDDTGFTKQEKWALDSYRLLVSPDSKQLTGMLRGSTGKYDIAFRADAF